MTPDGLRDRLLLMVVTDPSPASGRPLREVVEACLAGGATAVQLRHKGAAGAELFRTAAELRPLARDHRALFLVNDRLDVALAAGADGAHLGPEDVPIRAAREVVPEEFVLGYSTDDPAEARAAARAGADYLGVGSVYGTRSKEGLRDEAIGPGRVGEVLEAAGLPGVGIGGIEARNAFEVARAGAGVAVLSAAVHADDPGTAVRAIRAEVERARREG